MSGCDPLQVIRLTNGSTAGFKVERPSGAAGHGQVIRGLDPVVVDVKESQTAVVPAQTLGEFQAARLNDQYRAGVHLHHGSPCLCAAGLIVGVLAADSRTGTIDEGKAEVGDRPGHVALAADVVAVEQPTWAQAYGRAIAGGHLALAGENDADIRLRRIVRRHFDPARDREHDKAADPLDICH